MAGERSTFKSFAWNVTEGNQESGFCPDRFWDTDLLLTSSWPRFTQCFQYTVLVYVPFACFWIPLPVYMYKLASKGGQPLPMSCLSIIKMFLATSLSLLSIVLIIEDASKDTGDGPISSAQYLANSIRAISYAMVVFLIYFERKYHRTTSGVLFVLWTLLAICDVVPLCSKIMLEENKTFFVKFVLFALIYATEVLQVMLNCVSDSAGEQCFQDRTSPEVKASFPSQIFYWWVTRTVYRGWKKDLEESDLFDLNPRDSSDSLVPAFEREWVREMVRFKKKNGCQDKDSSDLHKMSDLSGRQEKEPLLANMNGKLQDGNQHYSAVTHDAKFPRSKKPKPSLLRVLSHLVGPKLLIGLIQKIISDVFLLLSPVLLSLLIDFAENQDSDFAWKGYALAVLLFVSQMFKSVLFNFSFWMSQIVGMQLKSTLIAAIYKKALTMNNESKKKSTAGEIVNLMSVDCQRVQDVMNFFFFAWTTPLQIIIAIAVLYQYIGPSAFAGLAVLLLTIPFNSYIAAKQQEFQVKNLKHKDARLRLTNESLSGMKVLKLYSWEPPFQTKISDLRDMETKVLLSIAYLNILISVCFNAAPYLVMLATFAVYVNVSDENHLDAKKAFVALSFFNLLKVPLSLLSTIISMSVQAIVSIERINTYLCTGDLNPDNVKKDSRSAYAIEVDKATFTWDKNTSPTLRNINLKIPVGKVYAVVGAVGCGKSSLMSALLGEMERLSGKACIKSSVAYVPQQAWIQNATVKDNILFGKPFNRKKYKRVISACALERDLEILSAGDQTEIGEKGINLSGGQKQRVSLARAVYSNADIYIFDDPLSAVDTHVGKHIFSNVIGQNGVLSKKTRVLVTHGAHWLPMVDSVVVMEDGLIRESGHYEDLMSHNGAFAEFIKTYMLQPQNDEEEEDQDEEILALKSRVLTDVESASATSDAATSGDEGFALSSRIKRQHRNVQRLGEQISPKLLDSNPKLVINIKQPPNSSNIDKDTGQNGFCRKNIDTSPIFQNKNLATIFEPRKSNMNEARQGLDQFSVTDSTERSVSSSTLHDLTWLSDSSNGPDPVLASTKLSSIEVKSSLPIPKLLLKVASKGKGKKEKLLKGKKKKRKVDRKGDGPDSDPRAYDFTLSPQIDAPAASGPGLDDSYILESSQINANSTIFTVIAEVHQPVLPSRTVPMTYESSMTASLLLHSQTVIFDESSSGDKGLGRLVQSERLETGKVKLSVFVSYAKATGKVAISISFLMFALFQVANAWSNFWLTSWTDDPYLANTSLTHTNKYKAKNDYYLGIFGLFGIIQIGFLITHNILYWIRMVLAAKRLHLAMLKSLFRSPMSFFDTTPLGRIMNRFSRDIEVVDNNLPIIIRDYTQTLFTCIVTLVIISISTPLFLSLVVPIMILYYFIQNFYIPTSRQLKRIESVTRSPIYTHFSETISGGPTIRAYGVTTRFVKESKTRVDRNQSFYYISLASNRWLGMNLELLANIIILGSAIFAVLTPGVSGGDVGLSVSYAIQVSSNLVWMVRQMSDLETNIVSVERLKEYSELDSEAEWVVPHRRPVPGWPVEGKVTFSDYMTRYRPGLDLVLKGISCDFKSGEKIGIVGRTGAGKSSLALALFRLVEASSGYITVDGVKISDIGLHDLRARLTILPQDPVLFFGTLRMNLDPVGEYEDHLLWKALTSAHLRDFVHSLPEGLDYAVGEEGQSLSVGQRQLVCLARALLKKTKILILDEATAAVDMETDTLIQNTIRTEFDSCTIITIAHRLNTIMDYDRIMVLDAGLVKELDSPTSLLADHNTIFYSMAKEANLI